MKKTTVLTAMAIAALLVSFLPAYSQGPQPGAPPQAPGAQAPGQPPASAAKMFEGELTKVDTNLKTITAKGKDQKEMSFVYNDTTTVVGGDKTVQGLAGKTGTDLRISYREDRGNNLATRIEIVEASQQRQPAPQQQPR
jgi:hypothetical protein